MHFSPSRHPLAAAVAAALALAGATAAPAAYEPFPLRDPARRWEIAGDLRAEYDDNIYTDEKNPESSFKTILEPQLLVNLPGTQSFGSLRYKYGATWYDNRPSDQWDQSHTADLLFAHTFTPRLNFDARDTFRYGVEPELVEVSQGVPVTTRRRGDYLYNRLAGNVDYNVSRRWTMSLEGDWVTWNYDEKTASVDDRNEYSTTASALFAINPRTTAGGSYDFGRVDYRDGGLDDQRNSDAHLLYAVLLHKFSPLLSGTLNGGAEFRQFDNGDSQTAPYLNASVTYNFAKRSSLSGGVRYGIFTTEAAGYRSTDTVYFFLQANHYLTMKWVASGGVSYGFSTFQNPTTPGLPTDEHEDTLALNLTLRYEITRWCSTDLSYYFTSVDSDLAGRSYDRNRVSLGLRFVY